MRTTPSIRAVACLMLCAMLAPTWAQTVTPDAASRIRKLDQVERAAREGSAAPALREQLDTTRRGTALEGARNAASGPVITDKQQRALDQATAAGRANSGSLNFGKFDSMKIEGLKDLNGIDIDPSQIARKYESLLNRDLAKGDGSEAPQELMVFASLSMPRESLKRLASEAGKLGVPLQFRGLSKGIGKNFSRSAAELAFITEAGGAAELNPDAFKRFDIRRVPAFVVTNSSKGGCSVDTCVNDAGVVYGDVGLAFALSTLSRRQDEVGKIARQTATRFEAAQRDPRQAEANQRGSAKP